MYILCICIYNVYIVGYYIAMKKSEAMPFAAIWTDLEIIILSKSERERQVPYDMTYVWNLTKQKQTQRHRKQT